VYELWYSAVLSQKQEVGKSTQCIPAKKTC
jgi:hypothetical protein